MEFFKLSQKMACGLMVMLALPVVAMSDSSRGYDSEEWYQVVYFNDEKEYQASPFEKKHPQYTELYRYMCSSLGNAKDALMSDKTNLEALEENLKDCFFSGFRFYKNEEKEGELLIDIKECTDRFVKLLKSNVNVKNFNSKYKYKGVFFNNFYMFCQTLENIKKNNPDTRFGLVNIDAVLTDCEAIKNEITQFSDQQLSKDFSYRIRAFVQSMQEVIKDFKAKKHKDLQSSLPITKKFDKFLVCLSEIWDYKSEAKINRVKDVLRMLNGMACPDTGILKCNIFYSNTPMMQWIYGAFNNLDRDLCKNFATVLKAIYQSVFENEFFNFSSFTNLEKTNLKPDDKTNDLISKLINEGIHDKYAEDQELTANFGELDKHEGIHDKYAEDQELTATFGERKRIRSESLNAKELKKRQKR